jgi:L-ribulose-5-phosphate 4-epimerase
MRTSPEIDESAAVLARLHGDLVANGLVAWTSGNISARLPGQPLFLIKPSGVPYRDLCAENMVLCDFDGKPVNDSLKPSSDVATHAYIYRQRPDIGGVAHTHSPYATAFAIQGEPIACVMTSMADEFGGEIPLGEFARIGDDAIGRIVVDTLDGHRSPAVLLRSHGVFTVGTDARGAVKAAVMCEDAARIAHLARQLGPTEALAPDIVDALHARYIADYGQATQSTLA